MNCNFCSRELGNTGALSIHEKSCKDNPNSIKRYRSPKAGPKKGIPSPHKGKKFGRGKHWDIKFPLDSVLVENSSYGRTHLKKRIIDNNIIPYVCACCGIGPEWQSKPMPLILDHKNGVNNDNRLENLRFVCSNCDSQLPTYKNRRGNKNK